jgi:hypothetical protein
VQAALQELLADIKRTNEHASNTLTGTLEEAMKKAADNQQVLIEQMREFVQEFKKLVEDERSPNKRSTMQCRKCWRTCLLPSRTWKPSEQALLKLRESGK